MQQMMGVCCKSGFVIVITLTMFLAPLCHGEEQQQLDQEHRLCFSPLGDDCSFYEHCMERFIPCGPRGYVMSFALPICKAFLAHTENPDIDAESKQWMEHVRKCLQTSVAPWLQQRVQEKKKAQQKEDQKKEEEDREEDIADDDDDYHNNDMVVNGSLCSQLSYFSFASHVPCYTAHPEHTICRHWMRLFPTVIRTIGWHRLVADWSVASNAVAVVRECAPWWWREWWQWMMMMSKV